MFGCHCRRQGREAAHERGRELRDQHKITDDLESERKKQAILSLILAVIVIALGIAGVVAFFQ
jgi:hypothetical protein